MAAKSPTRIIRASTSSYCAVTPAMSPRCARRRTVKASTQAMAASNTSGGVASYLKRAYFNEQEHYQSVAGILSGAGETPQVSADIDFSYPAGTFDSESSILKAAAALENTVAGAYAGAMGGIVTNQFKSGLAQIALCEAQHASYFAVQSGGKPFWLSFPAALTIQQASDAMNQYTS